MAISPRSKGLINVGGVVNRQGLGAPQTGVVPRPATPITKPAQPMARPVVAQPVARPVARPVVAPVARMAPQPVARPVAQPAIRPNPFVNNRQMPVGSPTQDQFASPTMPVVQTAPGIDQYLPGQPAFNPQPMQTQPVFGVEQYLPPTLAQQTFNPMPMPNVAQFYPNDTTYPVDMNPNPYVGGMAPAPNTAAYEGLPQFDFSSMMGQQPYDFTNAEVGPNMLANNAGFGGAKNS